MNIRYNVLSRIFLMSFFLFSFIASADVPCLMRIHYRIIDQDNLPVTNARVHLSWHDSAFRPPVDIYTETDSNGCFVAERSCEYYLFCGISKSGYYDTSDRINFSNNREPLTLRGDESLFYNLERVLQMKRRGEVEKLKIFPRSANYKKIPCLNQWIPFDLSCCDWCSPYGSGGHEDVLLRFHSRVVHPINDYDLGMDVSFTNSPYAGAYVMKKDLWSALTTTNKADFGQQYVSSFHFSKKRVPNEREMINRINEEDYLVFRVRVQVDADGNLLSAHYGTIHGCWEFNGQFMSIPDGCFNPIPNDLNIEDGRSLREYLASRSE